MPTSGGGMKDFVLLPLNDVIPGRIPTIFAQILPCRPPHVRSEISSLTHLQQFDLPSDWSAIEIGAAAAAWHYIFGEDQSAVVTRTVGGNATPVARRARLAAGRGRRSACRPARFRSRSANPTGRRSPTSISRGRDQSRNEETHARPADLVAGRATRGRIILNSVNSPACVSTSIDPPCCLTMMS